MTFDARSRERLEALGRRLPQPLPLPEPAAARPGASGENGRRRHRLETESDPQQLFRELMAASPDGTVPPHLMERLRDLEQRQPTAPASAIPPQKPLTESRSSTAGAAGRRRPGAAPPPSRSLSAEEQQQYATFAHLLLEDEEQS